MDLILGLRDRTGGGRDGVRVRTGDETRVQGSRREAEGLGTCRRDRVRKRSYTYSVHHGTMVGGKRGASLLLGYSGSKFVVGPRGNGSVGLCRGSSTIDVERCHPTGVPVLRVIWTKQGR